MNLAIIFSNFYSKRPRHKPALNNDKFLWVITFACATTQWKQFTTSEVTKRKITFVSSFHLVSLSLVPQVDHVKAKVCLSGGVPRVEKSLPYVWRSQFPLANNEESGDACARHSLVVPRWLPAPCHGASVARLLSGSRSCFRELGSHEFWRSLPRDLIEYFWMKQGTKSTFFEWKVRGRPRGWANRWISFDVGKCDGSLTVI